MARKYLKGTIAAGSGSAPVVSPRLDKTDILQHLMVRFSINRMNCRVEPGLYALGKPGAGSEVFVSANYKLSFDALRSSLEGIDCWMLVLDTKGINVWCAAGKGTFGTGELAGRIEKTGLGGVISHRRLIVPQLGAAGVSAHEVKKLSGFSVIYGPARAADIREFLKAGMKATPEMRKVRFSFADRLALAPMEFAGGLQYLVFCAALFFLLSGLNTGGYSGESALKYGLPATMNLVIAYIAGTLAGPLLLPFLPGRAFALKGAFLGLAAFIISYACGFAGGGALEGTAWFFLMISAASFLLMNFTGASTYTSLSGVLKEMTFAVPGQIAAAVSGIILFITGRLLT